MGSSHSNRHNRLSWAVGVSLAFAAGMSNSVLAETPKANAPKQASKVDADNPLGAMTFEHVRVVNVPAVSSPSSQSKSEGLKGYVDAQTKRLRQQTPEEALQAASETRVRAKPAKSSARGVSANTLEAAAEPQYIYGADGSVGLVLDEESMVYQVAHKDASGSVGQQCVNGKTEVTKALQSNAHNKQAEVHHDR